MDASNGTRRSAAVSRRARGISLIEVVVLIVIIGIAAGGVLTLFGSISRQSVVVDDKQRGLLLIESCAEVLLASRAMLSGHTKTTSASCVADDPEPICECNRLPLASFSPFTPRVTKVASSPTGTFPQLCYRSGGVGPTCVQLQIEAVGPGGSLSGTPVFLQLQSY